MDLEIAGLGGALPDKVEGVRHFGPLGEESKEPAVVRALGIVPRKTSGAVPRAHAQMFSKIIHGYALSSPTQTPLLKSLTPPKVLDLPFIRSATKLQMIRTETIEPAHLPATGRVVRSNFVSSLTVVATWDTIATIQEMLCKVEFPNLESLKLVHVDCPGPPLHSSCIRRPLVGTLSLKQLVFQGLAIRSQDLLDILGMAPRLTSLSIDDSSYPLVEPYRPISNALLVELADPKIVPDLKRLHLYWRHDVDIDGSLVASLLETRGNRLADVVTPKRRATV
ncbi:hypothetical protein EV421DRAFT_1737074 [Armillaria borealis]|uniref:F-box domain-containing protein n=1 Tax=Armillaria borealis TaxID=47425 RepID=A0AA39MNE9_9AGAR|nr:hypothetical protein EV421DRAFT_1737074 [Armillaria borealis]